MQNHWIILMVFVLVPREMEFIEVRVVTIRGDTDYMREMLIDKLKGSY